MVKNEGSPQKKFHKESVSLEKIIDLGEPLEQLQIIQASRGEYCLLLRQNSENSRLFFESSSELLAFKAFLEGDRSAPSPTYKATLTQEESDRFSIAGWQECVGEGILDSKSAGSLTDFAFEEYFYLTVEGQTIDQQIDRWKTGVKWFNRVVKVMRKEAQQAVLIGFKKGFGKKLEDLLIRKWNENSEKFNVKEHAIYHSFVGNICEATEIFEADSTAAEKLGLVLKASEISIVSVAVHNLADIVRNIINKFWSTDSFAFYQGEILCRSAIDIMHGISLVKDATEVMPSSKQEIVLKRVCIQ